MHNEETNNNDEALNNSEVLDNDEALVNDEALSEEYESEAAEAHSVVGIRFERCGKVYCFKGNGLELKRGERVVVESDLGVSIGRVVIEDNTRDARGKELKSVLRRVSDDDLKKEVDNISLKKETLDFCNERIMARGLAMKLLGTDVTLDRKRIVFFFTADTRIDFRELVKDLAAKFRTRIELRQVGVRDAARITGGLGVCGRELCCRQFLTSFLPISIKMAKKQELALNTSKLSGICGRLMCCLGYEYEEKLREKEKKARKEHEEDEAKEQETKEEIIEEIIEEVTEVTVEEPAPDSEPARTSPAEAEKPAGKRRRRKKRRSRGKPKAEQQPKEQAQAKPEEKKPDGEKAAVKKPFRRKRRRRKRGKKKE
jgi:cell fate regulator YaaT (PSP1 superfamily)